MKQTTYTCDLCGSEMQEPFISQTLIDKKSGQVTNVGVAVFENSKATRPMDICKECALKLASKWVSEIRQGELFK